MQHVSALTSLFDKYQITGYIIPANDEYFNEYTPDSAKRLQYITNFTGSNGITIICKNISLFFTDGRYLEQSKRELNNNYFQIFNINDLANFPWNEHLGNNYCLGYDPKLFTKSKISLFSKIEPNLSKIDTNLVDQIWQNKEQLISKIYIHDIEFAGQPYSEKIALCRKALIDNSANNMIITAPDSISWLLNLRGQDIPCTPLMLGKVIIQIDQVYLFTQLSKISQEVVDARPDITILAEEEFTKILSETNKFLIDYSFTSIYLMDLLRGKIVKNIHDPCQLAKARKNNIEIEHAVNFHIKDAVALCEFFADIFSLQDFSGSTEYELGVKLREFRSQQDGYIIDSFHTICGFQENSAIIHYRADKLNSKKIIGNGLLLIDSGGQYKGATTDVTRTFSIGDPTEEQKLRYTQVLKGHIALSTIKFPKGITGANLDILARQFLWKDEQDYPHGTGHGVGSFLSVHEGPQNISLRSNIPLEPGMVLSNEPGYYKTGEFGIRIENLIYVKKTEHFSSSCYLEFDNLTLVPYAKELIDNKMLNIDEQNYLKQYYKKIRQLVYPLLSTRAKKWVDEQIIM